MLLIMPIDFLQMTLLSTLEGVLCVAIFETLFTEPIISFASWDFGAYYLHCVFIWILAIAFTHSSPSLYVAL